MAKQFLTIKVPMQGTRHEYESTLDEQYRDNEEAFEAVKNDAARELLNHMKDQVRFEVNEFIGGGFSIKAYLVLAAEHTDMDGLRMEVTND